MVLIYILSILSVSSLFIEKTQPVQINQAEENNIIQVKTIKPQNTQISQEVDLGTEENNLTGTNTENSDIQSEDEYEEIIFHDDFDKEYRSDVENAYLE